MRELLVEPIKHCRGFLSLFCIKAGPQKQEKSVMNMALYIIFMFISFIALCLFDWPYIPNPALVSLTLVLFILSNFFYFLVSRANPGYLEK